MGGGEVARYITRHGLGRLHSVVFASAVPPCMLQTTKPDGPLTKELGATRTEGQDAFYDDFTTSWVRQGGFNQSAQEAG